MCPEEFFNNCKNAYLKCKSCSAFNEEQSWLYYQPVTGKKQDHPEYSKKSKVKKEDNKERKLSQKKNSKRTKDALKKEKEIQQKIVKETLKSGAIYGDGDYRLLEGKFNVDHKWKSKQKGFSVTPKEYEKGVAQGVTIWSVTNCDNNTCFILTEEAFYKLLQQANIEINNEQQTGEQDG